MKYSPVFYTLIIFLILFLTPQLSSAQENNTYKNDLYYAVTIPLKEDGIIRELGKKGIAIDHVHRKNNAIYAELNGFDLNQMLDMGIEFSVEVVDMASWYEQHLTADPVFQSGKITASNAPENFKLGSMGGHLTLDEVNSELDLMHQLYPEIITEKFSIGQSIEGRDLWTVWIGTELEETKPQAYYNSLIHAREPMSMMNLVYFMWWLLENYEEDELATFLIENRHMAFSLVLNPDGYEYNRFTNPNGGGLHRKNRRPTGDFNNMGVDLNRNFGPFQFWDHQNGGSSDFESSDTYRGQSPFSELETQAIRDFALDNDFRTVFNYHNYSDLLIYPYGVLQRETIDSHVFTAYAIEMTAENNYQYGTDIQTVGYNTRGAADDWFYGLEAGNPKDRVNAISMTPEVGSVSDGSGGSWGAFWARAERIVPISQENLLSNQLLALYAGPELRTENPLNPQLSKTTAEIGEVTSFNVLFDNELYNYGRSDMTVQLIASSQSEYVTFQKDTVSFVVNKDDTFSEAIDNFLMEVDPMTQTGQEISIAVDLKAPYHKEEYRWEYTFTAEGTPVFTEPGDETPMSISLNQNYPNPFNPTTTITYSLDRSTEVALTVYDVTGRLITTLVDGNKSRGEHTVHFDASQYPSGMYIYQLNAGGQKLIEKMTLIK